MEKVNFCRYRKGYKYQLASDFRIQTEIKPTSDLVTEFIQLSESGMLCVKQGYAWDGPSGPVIDRSENIRGSLVHDALYQLMRWKLLSPRKFRKEADRFFSELCKEDGLSSTLAQGYYRALRLFGFKAAQPSSKKKIYRAPKSKSRKKT